MNKNLNLDKALISTTKPGKSTPYKFKSETGEEFIAVDELFNPSLNYKEKIYYYPVYDAKGKLILKKDNIAKIFHTAGLQDFPTPWKKTDKGIAIWEYNRDGTGVVYYFDERPVMMERQRKQDANERDCFYKRKVIYDIKSGAPLVDTVVTSFGLSTKGYCTDFVMKETSYFYGGPGRYDEVKSRWFKGTGSSQTEISESEYNDALYSSNAQQRVYNEPQPFYEKPRSQKVYQEPKVLKTNIPESDAEEFQEFNEEEAQPVYEEPQVIKPKRVKNIPKSDAEEIEIQELDEEAQPVYNEPQPVYEEPKPKGECYFYINRTKGIDNKNILIPIDEYMNLTRAQFSAKINRNDFNNRNKIIQVHSYKNAIIAIEYYSRNYEYKEFNINEFEGLEKAINLCR